ncbi:O-methyltransferase [Teladorsagia circumcincta]|uniref:O-methyltransferase n=1 Tax=Teladorsagia circumcincta TaxID=45464 RepID=A0A2G9V5F9_TELCI|nr:O-methyltransferase [Teladorsagia circumcincta]
MQPGTRGVSRTLQRDEQRVGRIGRVIKAPQGFDAAAVKSIYDNLNGAVCKPMTSVGKSYHANADPVIAYCSKMTVVQHPLQEELQKVTLENAPMRGMLGAPEVLTVGSNLMHLIGAKRAIDVGTFTGASALSWALAAGEGGQVYTLDVNLDNFENFGVPVISKDPDVFKRIIPIKGPALASLDKLIADGESGKFDFAFIDADKVNYPLYYDRVVTLLRKGGVLMIDNALWHARVTGDPTTFDESTKAIHETNEMIHNDNRTYSALLNCGDGLHIAFKN